MQAADREIARQTALRARAVAEFARSRPATADRVPGEPGAMSPERWAARPEALRPVSEWATQELVVALSISSEAAQALLVRSLDLVHRLPGTLAALEAGALHPGHLWPMLDKVSAIEDDAVRADVEAGLLRWAAGRVTTPAQLGAKARREVARHDARAAARRLEKAIRERGVHLRSQPTDGLAAVTAVLTDPEATVLYRALGAYADAVEDDLGAEPRTRGQKMVDCLLDLVLRPGETALPPVQVLLTVVASVATLGGGDAPGEVDGSVVPAAMVRELVRLLGPPTSHPSAPVEHGVDEPASARVGPASGLTATADGLPHPAWQQVEQENLERWWAELERRVLAEELGTGPDPIPDPRLSLGGSSRPEPADWEPPDWEPFESAPPQDKACEHPPPVGGGAAWNDSGAAVLDGALEQAPDHPDHPDHPARPAAEVGWWAAADRAVDDAGLALRHVGAAMVHAERLVRRASVADDADEARWQAGAGRFTAADDALGALRACTEQQRARLAELLCASGGGGLVERPRIALTHAVSGALLALTDLPEMRRVGTCGARSCRRDPGRCTHDLSDRSGLGPPGPTGRYRPSAALDRWIRARDRRCRFPGCRRRVPRGGELDHDVPYPAGPTSATNLAGYCTGHHRGKHQAPGWRYALGADGSLTVTTPTGLTAVTTPPSY